MLHLDLPTLMLTGSFVAAMSGVFLLYVWVQYRGTPAALVWGLSDLITAAGVILIAADGAVPAPLSEIVGPALTLTGSMLVTGAARRFERLPARPLLLFGSLVAVFALIAAVGSRLPAAATAISFLATAAYLLVAARTLWRGWRHERLQARPPLIGLLCLHAAVFLMAIPETLGRHNAPVGPPPLTSWFGLIHFENMIFAIGAAIFLVTIIKERNEADFAAVARIDPLTLTASRRAFLEQAAAIIDRCRRDRRLVSVLVFDLDHFKLVNDGHGHAAGDQVLRVFGDTLRRTLRANDLAGRIGGEEFAVVLPGAEGAAAFALAERVRLAFGEAGRFVNGARVGATVSGGVAELPGTEMTLEALLDCADRALYQAKRNGRNRIEIGGPPSREETPVIRLA